MRFRLKKRLFSYFLKIYAVQLVQIAYLGILRRKADEGGLSIYASELGAERNLVRILDVLSHSSEHEAKIIASRMTEKSNDQDEFYGLEPDEAERIRALDDARSDKIAAAREPESEEMISSQMAAMLGRHLMALPMSVDLDTTQEQRRRLFAHVQREWTRLGEDEPYWSVLTDDQFRMARLGQREMDHFFEGGAATAEQFDRFCTRNGVAPKTGTALELGCGVGRISIPMASKFSQVHALDVSAAHLRLADMHAKAMGANNINFVQLREIDQMDSLPRVDLCYSVIVLQHNPPPVIEALIGALCRRLRNGGLLMIQVPTFMKDYSYATERYLSAPLQGMEMHCLPQAVIFRILADNGLRVLEVQEDGAVGNPQWVSQTFFAQKKAAPLIQLKQKLYGKAR